MVKDKISPSEVHAYVYIIKELIEKKDWKKSQIYTQQECLRDPEIRKYLVKIKPENILFECLVSIINRSTLQEPYKKVFYIKLLFIYRYLL